MVTKLARPMLKTLWMLRGFKSIACRVNSILRFWGSVHQTIANLGLKSSTLHKLCHRLCLTENDDDLYEYIKMYIILYADDTVILAKSPTELQLSLDAMQSYCNIWKSNINTSKTKIVIFSRGKVRKYPKLPKFKH